MCVCIVAHARDQYGIKLKLKKKLNFSLFFIFFKLHIFQIKSYTDFLQLFHTIIYQIQTFISQTIMPQYFLLIEDKQSIKKFKSILEKNNCLNKTKKIYADSNGVFKIPIKLDTSISDPKLYIEKLLPDLKNPILSKVQNEEKIPDFISNLSDLITKLNIQTDINISTLTLPKRYSIYPPLLLFPVNSLDSGNWLNFLNSLNQNLKDEIFKLILNYLSTSKNKLTHLAINKPIPEFDNEIRHPTQLTILYGNFNNFWCHSIQNGIYQTWMPLYTMFSRGNIKEKARILNSYHDISNNLDIVDLYAGIGYFTLSYLKRGAKRIFCWEINPYSVEGLSKGVSKNGFGSAYIIKRNESINLEKILNSKCIVFLESNIYCLERFKELKNLDININISHINLGLLPTSIDSWPYACELIDLYTEKNSISWIHVHENIGVNELNSFMDSTCNRLQVMSKTKKVNPIWLEKVKTFAPDVYHVVGDFKLTN